MASTFSSKQSQTTGIFPILVETLSGMPPVECSDALHAVPLVLDSALPRMVEHGMAPYLP